MDTQTEDRAFQIYLEILKVHMMDEEPVQLSDDLLDKYAKRATRMALSFNVAVRRYG